MHTACTLGRDADSDSTSTSTAFVTDLLANDLTDCNVALETEVEQEID